MKYLIDIESEYNIEDRKLEVAVYFCNYFYDDNRMNIVKSRDYISTFTISSGLLGMMTAEGVNKLIETHINLVLKEYEIRPNKTNKECNICGGNCGQC